MQMLNAHEIIEASVVIWCVHLT